MKFPAHPVIEWFLLKVLKRKWAPVRKDDPRFIRISSAHRTDGDSSAAPTTMSTEREYWKKCAVYRVLNAPAYMAFDDVFGNRMVCLGQMLTSGQLVALGVGHEPCEFFLVVTPEIDTGRDPVLQFQEYLPYATLNHDFPYITQL